MAMAGLYDAELRHFKAYAVEGPFEYDTPNPATVLFIVRTEPIV